MTFRYRTKDIPYSALGSVRKTLTIWWGPTRVGRGNRGGIGYRDPSLGYRCLFPDRVWLILLSFQDCQIPRSQAGHPEALVTHCSACCWSSASLCGLGPEERDIFRYRNKVIAHRDVAVTDKNFAGDTGFTYNDIKKILDEACAMFDAIAQRRI